MESRDKIKHRIGNYDVERRTERFQARELNLKKSPMLPQIIKRDGSVD